MHLLRLRGKNGPLAKGLMGKDEERRWLRKFGDDVLGAGSENRNL